MRKIVFPWNKEQLTTQSPLHTMEVTSSCRVCHFIAGGSLELGGQENPAFERRTLQLQLRKTHVVLFDLVSAEIVDFFLCKVDTYFLVREGKELQVQQIMVPLQKQKQFLVIQFAHENDARARATFLVEMENKKSLEQFGIALEKCELVQRDFHRKFKPLRKLGKGSTASVFSAVRLQDSSVVAIKAFNKSTHFTINGGKGKKAFEKELSILAHAEHQNICQFQGVYETENTIYIVMKNYAKTLTSALLTTHPLPREWVVAVMEDLLRGVSYLHSKGVMHRDLKLDNIMLHKSQSRIRPIIIDMGMAEYFNQQTYLFEQCGTPGYVAPEMFGPRPPHPEKCDIFSLGVIFYILLFKKSVFAGQSGAEVCKNNRQGNLNLDMELLDQEAEEIKDLLLKMLELDNPTRISAEQALNHDLFMSKATPPTVNQTQSQESASKTLSFLEI